MSLVSNTSSDELSSPFYVANKKICESFEEFIINKNGEVKGSYNASSYLVYGKFKIENEWVLKIKKSTFSSGNLLLSSEFQNLLVLSEWKTKLSNKNIPDFRIEKNRLKNIIKSLLKRKCRALPFNNRYSICSADSEHKFIYELFKILKKPFDKREVYFVEFKNGILSLELRTKDLYLELIDNIEKITNLPNFLP